MKRIACPGCGALVPDTPGPTHRYIGAPGAVLGALREVLAREYSDFRYASVHQLTVDSYAAQHPGEPSRQSIQSVAVHLISLHLMLERGYGSPASNESGPAGDVARERFRVARSARIPRRDDDRARTRRPATPPRIKNACGNGPPLFGARGSDTTKQCGGVGEAVGNRLEENSRLTPVPERACRDAPAGSHAARERL